MINQYFTNACTVGHAYPVDYSHGMSSKTIAYLMLSLRVTLLRLSGTVSAAPAGRPAASSRPAQYHTAGHAARCLIGRLSRDPWASSGRGRERRVSRDRGAV